MVSERLTPATKVVSMSTDLPADPNRHAVTPEPLETGAAASSHTATPQSAPTAPYPGQAEGPTQALPHTGQGVTRRYMNASTKLRAASAGLLMIGYAVS